MSCVLHMNKLITLQSDESLFLRGPLTHNVFCCAATGLTPTPYSSLRLS